MGGGGGEAQEDGARENSLMKMICDELQSTEEPLPSKINERSLKAMHFHRKIFW